MTPQEMKNSILQLAIQGKLVEQRPEEGTAEELYQQIQEEKKELIKAGKIKKEKPLPEITEDEIPFDIPESWKWVRLRDMTSVLGDGIHGTPVFDDAGDYYFVNGNNLVKGNIVFKTDTKKVSSSEYEKYKKPLDKNTILISINGSIGNYAFYTGEPIILGKSACYFSVLSGIDKEFVCHLLNTKFFMDHAVKEATQTTIKNVSLKAMRMFPVPLPPLAEQKRIVAKIEELLPYIDRYEKAWSRLEDLNKRFPVDMQKSILQMAIQGKLVEQRPEEGTAEELYQQIQEEKKQLTKAGKIKKEKPLPEITEDEIPFDIPESWKWCRLFDIATLENGDRSSKYPVDTDYVKFGVPFFGAKDMIGRYMSFENVRYISKSKFEELGNGKLKDNDFICLLRGSVGKIAIFKADAVRQTGFICAQMVIVRSMNCALVEYLYHIMTSPYYFGYVESKTTGTAVRQLPAKELGKLLLPLPPLAEQKRIVAKLDEILPLCKKLK